MVTLEQVLENFDSNDDSEMKRITAVITDLLVSYSGAIYISFVSKFYTCNGKGYIHMFKMICNGMCKGGSRSFFRQGFKKRNFLLESKVKSTTCITHPICMVLTRVYFL